MSQPNYQVVLPERIRQTALALHLEAIQRGRGLDYVAAMRTIYSKAAHRSMGVW